MCHTHCPAAQHDQNVSVSIGLGCWSVLLTQHRSLRLTFAPFRALTQLNHWTPLGHVWSTESVCWSISEIESALIRWFGILNPLVSPFQHLHLLRANCCQMHQRIKSRIHDLHSEHTLESNSQWCNCGLLCFVYLCNVLFWFFLVEKHRQSVRPLWRHPLVCGLPFWSLKFGTMGRSQSCVFFGASEFKWDAGSLLTRKNRGLRTSAPTSFFQTQKLRP